MYVCMVFGIISRTKVRIATNDVPKCRSPERALLRHDIIGERLLTAFCRNAPRTLKRLNANRGRALLYVYRNKIRCSI